MRQLARKIYRYLIPTVALILVFLFSVSVIQECNSQDLSTESHVSITAWNTHSYCYQHTMSAGGQGRIDWGPVFLRGKLKIRRWGACDSKIKSAIFNAESGKTYSRWQNILIGASINNFELGVQYDRRSVHHVWRHKDRHDYFPGNYEIGLSGCRGNGTPSYPDGEGCPSLGYWDGLRPHVAYKSDNINAFVKGPLWNWKSLTLPWPNWRGYFKYKYNRWNISTYIQGGGHRSWRGNIELQRQITNHLFLGVLVSRPALPEWRDRIADHIGISVNLK